MGILLAHRNKEISPAHLQSSRVSINKADAPIFRVNRAFYFYGLLSTYPISALSLPLLPLVLLQTLGTIA